MGFRLECKHEESATFYLLFNHNTFPPQKGPSCPTQNRDFSHQNLRQLVSEGVGGGDIFSPTFSPSHRYEALRRVCRRSSQVYIPSRDRSTARLAKSELQFQQWRAQVVVAPSSRGSASQKPEDFWCVRACVCVCAARVWTPEVGAGLWFPAEDVSDTGSARCCRIFFGLSADGARRGEKKKDGLGTSPRR